VQSTRSLSWFVVHDQLGFAMLLGLSRWPLDRGPVVRYVSSEARALIVLFILGAPTS